MTRDDLEEIELGVRVSYWLTMSQLASLYSTPEARCEAHTANMAGAVATAASHAGRAFPEEWWPPSAGTMPDDLKAAAPVAQRTEHLATDQEAGGSIPSGRTKEPDDGRAVACAG